MFFLEQLMFYESIAAKHPDPIRAEPSYLEFCLVNPENFLISYTTWNIPDYASASWHLPTGQLPVVQDFSHQYFKLIATFAGPIRLFGFVSGENMFMAFRGICCTYKIAETPAFQNCMFIIASDETEVKKSLLWIWISN